jgi:hypothetical protein
LIQHSFANAAPFELYLIDAGTGGVALHGWRYGIAVGRGGEGRGGRHAAQRLAVVTPAAPPAAAPAPPPSAQ